MTEIKDLKWDSRFYQLRIGRVDLNIATTSVWEDVLVRCRQENYDLIYGFSDDGLAIEDDLLSQFGGHLADEKVIFEQTLLGDISHQPSEHIASFAAANPEPGMHDIAIQCGVYSRFKLDPMLPNARFEEMYRIWLERSIDGSLAEAVHVYRHQGKVTGLITLVNKGEAGEIGLLGVDASMRGKGAGTALVDSARKYFTEKGMKRLQVATQGGNQPACQFYERNGFGRSQVHKVYHFWVNR